MTASPSRPKPAIAPRDGEGPGVAAEVAKILASGQRLLAQVEQMNPNSARYPLKSELCEAEFRDVLRLDARNVEAVVGLSALFASHWDEVASAEALSLLDEALAHSPTHKALKACRNKHEQILKELAADD